MAVPTREPTRIDGSMNSHWDGTLPSNTSASSVRHIETSMPRKIGVLGLGSIGRRHYRNFKDLGCEVETYDLQANGGKGLTSLNHDSLLEWADAIVIATPTVQHYQDIIDCHDAHRYVFVEKPIISTRNHWAAISTTHIKMVGYNLRFHSCVKRAREWLGEGLIGKPLWARFTCAQYNNKADYIRDGVILNWSHEIDLAIHLLGHAVMMAAVGDDQSTVDIILNHDVTHCQTVVHLDYLTKYERRGFLIVGTDGSIEVDLLRRKAFCPDNRGLYTRNFHGRDTFDENYVAEAHAFLDRLDGKDVDGCTAAEAMHVADICLLAKVHMK